MKINFFAGENKFIYGKKFSGIREEIISLSGGNSTAHNIRELQCGLQLILMRFTIDWSPQPNFIGPAYRDESSCISCVFLVMLRRAWFQLFSGNRPGFQDFLSKFATQFH